MAFDTQSIRSKFDRAILLIAVFLLVVGVRLTLIDSHAFQMPYWDDWGMGSFLLKSLTDGIVLGDYFATSNEHRLAFNKLISLALFNMNHEQWDPRIMMIVNSVIWGLTAITLFSIAIRHLPADNQPIVFAFLLFVFIFPIGMVNIIWGIQTHTYTMILFSVLGCWLISDEPFSLKWWLGLISLASAPLTLAGGAFVAFAVAVCQIFTLWLGQTWERKPVAGLAIVSFVAIVGISLVLSKQGVNQSPNLDTVNAVLAFLKALAWPATYTQWAALVFALPPVLLFWQLIRKRQTPTRLEQFVLSLALFVALIAFAIAYARGDGVNGPARRYFEFLALFSFASLICLIKLEQPSSARAEFAQSILKVCWLGMFLASLPWLHKAYTFSVEERAQLNTGHEESMHEFFNTKSVGSFALRPPAETPFPLTQVQAFADSIEEMQTRDMLPYELQKPAVLRWNNNVLRPQRQQSAFITNGNYRAAQREYKNQYRGEDTIGSFRRDKGGEKATGTFKSEVIRISRPFAAIPVMGFLGYPKQTLKFVDVGSGEEFNVVPDELHARFAEAWRLVVMPLPRGYYTVEAEDQHESLWFSFGAPRSVGRITYFSEKAISNGGLIWRLGLLLLLFALRDDLSRAMQPKKAASEN